MMLQLEKIKNLPEILLKRDFLCFVKTESGVKVFVDDYFDLHERLEEIETELRTLLKNDLKDLKFHFTGSPHGASWDWVPVYSLALKQGGPNSYDLFLKPLSKGELRTVDEPEFRSFYKAGDQIKAESSREDALAEAEESLKEDKIKMFRFFHNLKPTRAVSGNEPQSVEAVLKRVGDYEWFVEVKKDGMTCLAYKEGQKVEIWSEDGTERTKELPKVADAIRKLNVSSCILGMEVELWEGGHHFPREAIAGKIHRRGEPETEGIVATVFECMYLNGKDLHKEDEEVRRHALDSIKFPQSTEGVPDTKLALNKLPTHRGRGKEDIEKLMRKVINAPGSEGAVLKRVDAKYYLDGNSRMEWFKYHKTSRVFGIVYEIQETKKEGIFNYLYALGFGKYKVKQSQQVKVGEKNYIKVGKTFSTDTVVRKGQIIEIEIETLNFTVDERDDSIQIGCWCPRFLRIASERKTPDSVDEAVKRAKANGVLSEKKIDKDGETHYLEKKNLEDNLTEVCKIFKPPPEDKTYRYAVSAHFIGRSSHWDDRVEYNDKLQGFTLAVLMPGALKEPVETMAQARKAIKNPDLWKINPRTGEFRKRRVRSGVVRRTSIWAALKAPEPKAWLGYEGVITAGPGRSRYHVGVLVTVDKGVAEYGSILPYFVEFFRHGKVFNGRYFYRMLPTKRAREVEKLEGRALLEYLVYNENEINSELHEIFKQELGPAEEQPARGGYFWLLIKPDDQTPYVLQKDTVQKGWVPPEGISALPKEIRKKVPSDLQYWKKKSLSERRKLRNELVKYFEEEKVTKSTAKFVLQYQTFRGPIHVRFGPTTEIWRFWIKKDNTISHYVFESDPIKKIAAGLRESYASEKEMNLGVGSEEPVKVDPGTRLNPTKNTPSFIEVVASGSLTFLEDSREFKKFRIRSGPMRGLWILFKERPDINIWTLSRTEEGPGLNKNFYVPIVKVAPEKRLVYGEVLVPETEDAQGDIVPADVIEDAAHDFLVNSRRIDVQHAFLSTRCFPVESFIAPTSFRLGDHLVKKGTWVLVTKIFDEEIWKKVKNGELRGYSIRGIAEEVPLD